MARQFNADEKAGEDQVEATIGGKTYVSVKRTGDVVKQIIALAPDDDPVDDDKKLTPAEAREFANESIDLVYKQLAILLVEQETRQHPSAEAIETELEVEAARELVRMILPPPEVEAEASTDEEPEPESPADDS